jgi:hypothetical protein
MPLTASDWSQIAPTSQSAPLTIASAATIAPLTYLTVLTGNVAISNITPPVTHTHTLALQFAGTGGVASGGNILTTTASVAGQIMTLVYNPLIAKYVPAG